MKPVISTLLSIGVAAAVILTPHFAGAQAPDSTPNVFDPENGGESSDEDTDEDEDSAVAYWRAALPGGTFTVAQDSINAVSMHEYVLDGAARVTEVNISISGTLQPRFYHIEALPVPGSGPTAQLADRGSQAIQSAATRVVPGDPVWAKVAKSYPTTTHAGTIEYRLESKNDLKNLFEHLEESFLSGTSRTFSPGGGGGGDPEDRSRRDRENGDGSDRSGGDSEASMNPDGSN